MTKKIMFNDKFGLTKAVLNGTKTMTRRNIKYVFSNDRYVDCENHIFYFKDEVGEYPIKPKYNIGEKVAIAQKYSSLNLAGLRYDSDNKQVGTHFELKQVAGWNNKMFVRADLMPHLIEITGIRVERLQDISPDDCIKEGIEDIAMEGDDHIEYGFMDKKKGYYLTYHKVKEAYQHLIDKISGKGTWEQNPYVFVYEFKLVK